MNTNIETKKEKKPLSILEIGKTLGLSEKDIIPYGWDKAKIQIQPNNEKGKLILVTSTSPTPLGEGKTTITIGLHDALCHLGKKSVAVLREPSLGPTFGVKGGASGGGCAKTIPSLQVIPTVVVPFTIFSSSM